MIEEVALRLPPKTVGRFRCASKAWRSRLSSPAFVRAHSNFHIHTAPVRIIFEYFVMDHADRKKYAREELRLMGCSDYEPSDSDESFDDYNMRPLERHLITFAAGGGAGKLVTSPLFKRGWVAAAAAFHGLVVVEIETGEKTKMFLFNPLTKEALKLPSFRSKCRHALGLGYDNLNDDYKMVRLSVERDDATFVEVYSFKMNSWRKLGKSPYYLEFTSPAPCPGVFVNGYFHWLARDSGGSGSYVIAAFSLAKEEFEEVPSPPEGSECSCDEDCCDDSCEVFQGFDDCSQVIVFRGCLAVVCTPTEDWIYERINIWVMAEYGAQGSWNKVVIDTKDRYRGIGNFFCLLRDDEVVFRQFKSDNDQFAAYSLSTRVWRDITVDGNRYEFLPVENYSGVVAFTESLLSPNHILH